jgi:hypothetical protein
MTVYLKRLTSWILQGKYLFFLILIIVAVFQIDILPGNKVNNIRGFGLILQLIGTCIVVNSLTAKLQQFNGYGLLRFIWNFIKSFPLKQVKKTQTMTGTTASYSMTGKSRLTNASQDDVKGMLEYLKEEVNYLHKNLSDLSQEVKKTTHDLDLKINTVRNALSTEIFETKESIKNSAVSNVWPEIFGLACIFIGLILGTIPLTASLIV